jgi:hypothetical protein
MEAQLMFVRPADVGPGIAALIEADFSVEVQQDLIDECGPTVFVLPRPQARSMRASFSTGRKP